jgi:hypothetical protein
VGIEKLQAKNEAHVKIGNRISGFKTTKWLNGNVDYHQPYSDLFRKCTVWLEQEVLKYGIAKSEWKNKS